MTQPSPRKIQTTCSHSAGTTPKGFKTAVFLPDPQFGYRYEGSKAVPFHDEASLDLSLSLVHAIKPDVVILLGDVLDFAELTLKYAVEQGFANTTQAALDAAYLYLVELRAAIRRSTQVVFMAGNHDERLPRLLEHNAKALLGLKKADTNGWPALSVPHLLRLDELRVDYVDGYPANRFLLTDRLQAIHGVKVRSNGSTAKAVVDDLTGTSTVFGHIHRVEYSERTIHTPQGPKTIFGASPGCLCRIDGAVPSVRGGTSNSGRRITNFENWQQGIGVAHYDKDSVHYSNIVIRQKANKRSAIWQGELYRI